MDELGTEKFRTMVLVVREERERLATWMDQQWPWLSGFAVVFLNCLVPNLPAEAPSRDIHRGPDWAIKARQSALP